MISHETIKGKHIGRPAGILGGGPSLPSDLARLPKEAILIAVNDHALKWCEPEFMVFLDMPNDVPDLLDAIRTYQGLKISPKPEWTDVDITGSGWWDGGFSSPTAVWLAFHMGCCPILLCGMDLYQGEVKYANRDRRVPVPDHPVYSYPLENHLRAWRTAMKKCPNTEIIKAVSGPLVEMFGSLE
jgi:hypothetical protein